MWGMGGRGRGATRRTLGSRQSRPSTTRRLCGGEDANGEGGLSARAAIEGRLASRAAWRWRGARLAMRRFGLSPVYTASADYFEWRDLYSTFREGPAYLKYALRSYP